MVDGDSQIGIQMRNVLGSARLGFFTPIHHQPSLADRKATFLMGATGLISTVLLMFSPNIAHLIEVRNVAVSILVLAMLLPIMGLLIFGGWLSWKCFVLPVPKMPQSLAYFPDIARRDLAEYSAVMGAIDYQTAIRAILDYNYSISVQAAGKYRLVNRSFACFRVALVLWMLLVVVISVAG